MCPANGLKHYQWEGEVCANTGGCCFQGHLTTEGREFVDEILPLSPGRYLVSGEWEYENFYLVTCELEVPA